MRSQRGGAGPGGPGPARPGVTGSFDLLQTKPPSPDVNGGFGVNVYSSPERLCHGTRKRHLTSTSHGPDLRLRCEKRVGVAQVPRSGSVPALRSAIGWARLRGVATPTVEGRAAVAVGREGRAAPGEAAVEEEGELVPLGPSSGAGCSPKLCREVTAGAVCMVVVACVRLAGPPRPQVAGAGWRLWCWRCGLVQSYLSRAAMLVKHQCWGGSLRENRLLRTSEVN